MSRENAEIVRAAFEAWMRGDLDAMLANADPDIEWYVLPDAPDPGPTEAAPSFWSGWPCGETCLPFGRKCSSTSTRGST
jgi:hypothetical protein